MTYYYSQIQKLRHQLYSKDYLIQRVIKAKHFIDNNFAEKLNIDDLAAKAFLSRFHFIRVFKSLYGITPYQYLTSVRIKHAKKVLQNNAGILEACIAAGFESGTYFIGLFKKMTGLTPGLYRQKSNYQESIL
jgi:AraC-like DNA-binding protein